MPVSTSVDHRHESGVKLAEEALRRLVPLDTLGPRSLSYIADHTRVLTLVHREVLFEIGDTSPFTFYLVRGAVSLKDANGMRTLVEASSERGRYALGNLLPRRLRARVASTRALVARIQRDLLEKEIAWGQVPKTDKKGKRSDDQEWRIDLLRTPTFARLPMANVQRLFEQLEERHCRASEVIIREGDPGDYYYIIRTGSCRVVRQVQGLKIRLATLQAPSAFGDEALVSDRPRNATVIMETDGVLLRLSKADFQSLMQAPLVRRVGLVQAQRAVAEGKVVLIDVRMEEELAAGHLSQAVHIPLYLLHLRAQTLNKGSKYVAYCDTGKRSETAAFLLTRKGFDAYVLEDAAAALAEAGADRPPD
jgi:CRP-like cAMP-binding protein